MGRRIHSDASMRHLSLCRSSVLFQVLRLRPANGVRLESCAFFPLIGRGRAPHRGKHDLIRMFRGVTSRNFSRLQSKRAGAGVPAGATSGLLPWIAAVARRQHRGPSRSARSPDTGSAPRSGRSRGGWRTTTARGPQPQSRVGSAFGNLPAVGSLRTREAQIQTVERRSSQGGILEVGPHPEHPSSRLGGTVLSLISTGAGWS
jgi:hypothetical protein